MRMRTLQARNENDENAETTTRSKSAALAAVPDNITKVTKKTATRKTSTISSSTTAPTQRRRAALGDVSNVTKQDPTEPKEARKPLNSKAGLVSKAIQNAGVQKVTRSVSTRSALATKDANKKAATTNLKRPASGAGVIGGVIKKRQLGSISSQTPIKESTPESQNGAHVKQSVTVEIETKFERKVAPKVEKKTKKESSITIGDNEGPVFEEPEPEPEAAQIKEAFAAEAADLDAEDMRDPLMVAEYAVEIFDYLRELEITTMPNPSYMDHQDNLQWNLRGILVDWLIEVHTRFHLLPETIFLAVNIIDRFLSARIVELDRLQLVGITAMFIASKYEEVLSPHVGNFKHIADNGFTEAEILRAERFVLSALEYDLGYPNPMNFLRRISKADNYDIQTRTIGKYFLEISLLDHNFMPYQPSHIAAASMYLARLILERGEWVRACNVFSLELMLIEHRMRTLPNTQATPMKRYSL